MVSSNSAVDVLSSHCVIIFSLDLHLFYLSFVLLIIAPGFPFHHYAPHEECFLIHLRVHLTKFMILHVANMDISTFTSILAVTSAFRSWYSVSGIAFEGSSDNSPCNCHIKIIKQTGKVAALEKLVVGKYNKCMPVLAQMVVSSGLFKHSYTSDIGCLIRVIALLRLLNIRDHHTSVIDSWNTWVA